MVQWFPSPMQKSGGCAPRRESELAFLLRSLIGRSPPPSPRVACVFLDDFSRRISFSFSFSFSFYYTFPPKDTSRQKEKNDKEQREKCGGCVTASGQAARRLELIPGRARTTVSRSHVILHSRHPSSKLCSCLIVNIPRRPRVVEHGPFCRRGNAATLFVGVLSRNAGVRWTCARSLWLFGQPRRSVRSPEAGAQ